MSTTSQHTGGSTSQLPNTNIFELNETVSRIASHQGVVIVQILNTNGDIIVESNNILSSSNRGTPSTPSISSPINDSQISNDINSSSKSTAIAARKLLNTAQSYLQSLTDSHDDTTNNDEITFLQIRSKNGYELMIAPHCGFALVVVKEL